MAGRNRSLARRKAKQDQKARTPQAPAAQEPGKHTETKPWTEAEIKAFNKKNAVFQDAMQDVNEFLEFLKEQHDVDAKSGWQLGNGGFIREVSAPPASTGDGQTGDPETPPSDPAPAAKKTPAKPKAATKAKQPAKDKLVPAPITDSEKSADPLVAPSAMPNVTVEGKAAVSLPM